MEVDKINEGGNENPSTSISGGYIRTLVKHLKTKDPINPNSSSSSSNTNPCKMAENQKAPPQTQHHKKQVRRRLHTTRPYQERLLNMAEARREIVTALKYHRAAMKKAAAADHNRQPQTPPDPPARCQEGKIRARKIPKSSSSSSSNFDNHNNNIGNLCYPWMMNSYPSWGMNWEAAEEKNLEIVLPEQTLGLNLNLQDFKNLEANMFSKGSVSGSSSIFAMDEEGVNGGESNRGGVGGGGGMHVAVGEEEMAEIRSIGEKHSVEWSDKMNMVKSAWWLRFMKKEGEFEFEFEFGDPFDQILEFPDWINNGSQTCFEEQLLSDCHFFHHHPSPALPCMDIGEFEGMDGEWLA